MTSPEETSIEHAAPSRLGELRTRLSRTALNDVADSSNEEVMLPPGRVLSVAEFDAWAAQQGYRDKKRGTSNNGDSYLYAKYCHEVRSENSIPAALAALRYLTAKGVLNPKTRWGVFKHEDPQDGYQIFAVSPKIEAYSLDDHHDTEFADQLTEMFGSDFKLVEWYRRVDPSFTPGETLPEDSLLRLMNPTEALHRANWGRDTETGRLYPVDVEVINIVREPGVVMEWYKNHADITAPTA